MTQDGAQEQAGQGMPAGTRVRDGSRRKGTVIPVDDVRYALPNSVLVRLDTKLHGHWNYWYRPEQLTVLAAGTEATE